MSTYGSRSTTDTLCCTTIHHLLGKKAFENNGRGIVTHELPLTFRKYPRRIPEFGPSNFKVMRYLQREPEIGILVLGLDDGIFSIPVN
jgi:hypothetical protein